MSPLQCADRFNPALGQATPAAKAAAKAKKVGGAFCFGTRTGHTRDNPNTHNTQITPAGDGHSTLEIVVHPGRGSDHAGVLRV